MNPRTINFIIIYLRVRLLAIPLNWRQYLQQFDFINLLILSPTFLAAPVNRFHPLHLLPHNFNSRSCWVNLLRHLDFIITISWAIHFLLLREMLTLEYQYLFGFTHSSLYLIDLHFFTVPSKLIISFLKWHEYFDWAENLLVIIKLFICYYCVF